MHKKLIIIFFAVTVLFALSCKKKRLANDLCDCGNSISRVETDTIDLIIPNIITPNWDAFNERWEILGLEYFQHVSVKIINEGIIGRTVFESNGYAEAWNGTYKGNKLKDGKYYYEITFDDQMTTGYVCIYTAVPPEPEYRDCLRKCVAIDAMDPVLH